MSSDFRILIAVLLALVGIAWLGIAVGEDKDSEPCGQYESQEAIDFCAENLP